jgi:hypothetical protein
LSDSFLETLYNAILLLHMFAIYCILLWLNFSIYTIFSTNYRVVDMYEIRAVSDSICANSLFYFSLFLSFAALDYIKELRLASLQQFFWSDYHIIANTWDVGSILQCGDNDTVILRTLFSIRVTIGLCYVQCKKKKSVVTFYIFCFINILNTRSRLCTQSKHIGTECTRRKIVKFLEGGKWKFFAFQKNTFLCPKKIVMVEHE